MKKILIIDDDQDILEALYLLLINNHYDVKGITESDDVLQLVKDYKPTLIILDMLLSGYDGKNICKLLKNDKRTKVIPIIMISAHPTASAIVIESGADAFIPKPFSISELLEEVKKYTT